MLNGINKRFTLTLVILIVFVCAVMITGLVPDNSSESFARAATDTDCTYLSDLEFEPESEAGWKDKNYPKGRIFKDKTVTGSTISVKVEGAWYEFEKGIFSHATANIYYDIRDCGYNYFTAYVGLDKICTKNSNGVKFYVYTSIDKINWTLKTSQNPTVKTIGAESEFLSVDISDANYLRLYVDPNGKDQADYAVWADAKLTNSVTGDDGSGIEPLSYYDDLIKERNKTYGLEDETLELLVLQREFVRKVGQYALKRFMTESEDNKILMDWLFKDVDNLREFVMGGDPMQGSYYKALTVLAALYKNYKSDLDNNELLNNKWKPDRTYGDLYKTMMFSVALTHDGTVGAWMQKERPENQSEPLRRYAIFRFLHSDGRFVATSTFETASIFESLTVEEMRWIMYNIIDDESIIWLNDYVQTQINAHPERVGNLHTPHSYIAYTTPNYANPVYYAEEYKDYFNQLFAVDARDGSGRKIGMWDTSYTIPGGVDNPHYTLTVTRGTESNKVLKMWMNFRNQFLTGCVCGGISKCGTNIRTARGLPSTVIGQPGHAAILYYTVNSDGKGLWGIDNNVGGWTVATKGERHLLGWGNEKWQRTHPTVVYFHLAQDALNDYDNYVKAEENVMLARVYEGNSDKQQELFETALTIQPINIDAWYGLIQTYIADKTETELLGLAKRIANTMVGYPLPMYNLLNVIKPELKTVSGVYEYSFLENKALKASSELPNSATDKTLQPAVARVEALYLLGNVDTSIADFSFDGENAGCIVWSSRFDNTDFRWKYSLDGGNTWSEDLNFAEGDPHKHQLSTEELASITEDNDIYVQIVGSSEKYKIDISSKPSLPNNLYANDYENAIFGLNDTFEWRWKNADSDVWTSWTSYADAVPDCSGDKTVEVRIKATGDKPTSDVKAFAFTANTDTETRKYVSISELTIAGFSSQSKDARRPNYATNAIDGNSNTYWHTDYSDGSTVLSNLIIKLNSPKYVSGLEFIQVQYNPTINIFARNVKVSVSENMTDWTEVGKLENLEALNELKSVQFSDSVLGQYVKLELESYSIFSTVSLINIYEDTTKTVPSTGDDTPDNPNDDNTPDNPSDSGNSGNLNNGNNTGNSDNGNSSGDQSGNNDSQPYDDNKTVKIVVPIVVVAVTAVAATAAALIIIKRKKSKNGGNDGKPEPKASKPEPKATKPEPKATKPEPKATKPEPKATKPEPKASKPEPKATKPEPKTTKPEPKATKPEPKTTKPEPKETKPEPKATKPEPKASKPEPKATKPEPKASKPTPKAPKSEAKEVKVQTKQTETKKAPTTKKAAK